MLRTIFRIVFSVLAVLVIAAILFPLVARRRTGPLHASCMSNLKQLALGVAQYAQDYDDRYPLISVDPVSSSLSPYAMPYGWADSLQPYLKSTGILQCPSEPTEANAHADGVASNFTDYWYNTNLSGAGYRAIDPLDSMIMLGDGNDGTDLTDARYNRNSFPLSWLQDHDRPAYRHIDGANYAFTDGHVKWLIPGKITVTRPTKTSPYTFAIQ